MEDCIYINFQDNTHIEIIKKLDYAGISDGAIKGLKYMLFDMSTGDIKAFVINEEHFDVSTGDTKAVTNEDAIICLNNEFSNITEIISYKAINEIDESILLMHRNTYKNKE